MKLRNMNQKNKGDLKRPWAKGPAISFGSATTSGSGVLAHGSPMTARRHSGHGVSSARVDVPRKSVDLCLPDELGKEMGAVTKVRTQRYNINEKLINK